MGVATAIIAIGMFMIHPQRNNALTRMTGIMVTASVGPEKRGSHFESAVIGQQTMAAQEKAGDLERGSIDKPAEPEKVEIPESK